MSMALIFSIIISVFADELTRTQTSRPLGGEVFRTYHILEFVDQATLQLNISDSYRFTVPASGDLNSLCVGADQYFNADGTLGEKGRILKRELISSRGARSTPMRGLYFRNRFPNINRLCRNFDNFNDDEKLNFWIWYFASKARTESECGRNAYNPNDPDGISVGEMQMPASWENRRWRGINDDGTERGGAGGCYANPPAVRPPSRSHRTTPSLLMAQTENNLTCSVEVLSGVLCGFYRDPTERCNDTTNALYGHGFWRQLRVNDDESFSASPIIRNIRSFPLCGN